jgi:hypothetical protein
MANQPIPVSQANDMIKQYLDYLQKLGVDPNSQTQSVSFTSNELLKWQSDVMPFADELRICFGVYPPAAENAGRITSILWPYKNGKPATRPKAEGKDGGEEGEIDPYNSGQLNP